MDGADVCITSRRPPDVTCGAAILDSRWRRRKWRQPRLGAAFSIPIVVVVENGDPSASGRHLGWPHLRNRKWGHPRWRPEAEGPPFFHHHHNGDRKGRPILLVSLNSGPSFILYYNLKARYLSSFNGKVFRPGTRDVPLQINVLSQQSPLLCLRDPVKLSCLKSDLDITRNLKTTRHSDNHQPPLSSTFSQTPDHRFTGNL